MGDKIKIELVGQRIFVVRTIPFKRLYMRFQVDSNIQLGLGICFFVLLFFNLVSSFI